MELTVKRILMSVKGQKATKSAITAFVSTTSEDSNVFADLDSQAIFVNSTSMSVYGIIAKMELHAKIWKMLINVFAFQDTKVMERILKSTYV